MIRKLLATLAAPALLFAPVHTAHAQDRFAQVVSAMPEEDLSALMLFAAPPMFSQLQEKCSPHLPSDSYIYANGDELAQRFAVASIGTDESAIRALSKLGDKEEQAFAQMLENMPVEVVGPFVKEFIAAEFGREITADSCEPINRALELLDPMPAQNLTDLFAFFLVLMANDEMEKANQKDG